MEAEFFNEWKQGTNMYKHLELMLTYHCNLNCEYCYIHKNGPTLFPPHLCNTDTICNNIVKLLTWLGENGMNPNLELFTGELFSSEDGYRILECILHFYQSHFYKYKVPNQIIVPTNFAFLDTNSDLRVQGIIHSFSEMRIGVFFSASFDGLYADPIARPFKSGLERTQRWYDRCFSWLSHMDQLPHPMIAPSTIHLWEKNFLWFMDMFKKYDMDPKDLYLLEVRNANWTTKNLQDYKHFCEFVMDWIWDYTLHNPKEFLQFFCVDTIKHYVGGFNFLGAQFFSNHSAPGCTIQNYLFVRMGDLKMFPCHRLAYPQFELGQLNITDDNQLDLQSKNVALASEIYSFSPNLLPMCNKCAIKDLCGGQCYGSCFETTGNMFNPIPTVCALQTIKIKVIIAKLKEYNVFYDFLGKIDQEKAIQLLRLAEEDEKQDG